MGGSSAQASRMWRKRRASMLEMANGGQSYKQIAERFGISESVVGVLVRKAKTETRIRIFKKTLGRIDATQPDDPPRGVWIE